jgi:hypothetical protein
MYIAVACGLVGQPALSFADLDADIESKIEESLFAPDPFSPVYDFLQEVPPLQSAFEVEKAEDVFQPNKEPGESEQKPNNPYQTIDVWGGLGNKQNYQLDGLYGLETPILDQVVLGKYSSVGKDTQLGYRENLQAKYDWLFNLGSKYQLAGELDYNRDYKAYQLYGDTGPIANEVSLDKNQHKYLDIASSAILGDNFEVFLKSGADFDDLENHLDHKKHRTLNGELRANFIWPEHNYLTRLETAVYQDWAFSGPSKTTYLSLSLENDFPIKERLFLIIGGRIDSYLHLTTGVYPSLGVHLRVNPKTGFYFYYRPQIKRLDFHQLFFQRDFSTPTEPLKPTQEYSSLTAGFNYNFSQLIQGSIDFYRQDDLDYIYYSDSDGLITPKNLHRATIYGFKVSYSFKAGNNFDHYASLNIETIIDDEKNFNKIPYHPAIIFNAGIQLSPLKFWELNITGQYNGKRYTSTQGVNLGSYFILNTQSVLWIKPSIGLDVRGENLLNSQYQEIINLTNPGMFISAGLHFKI